MMFKKSETRGLTINK